MKISLANFYVVVLVLLVGCSDTNEPNEVAEPKAEAEITVKADVQDRPESGILPVVALEPRLQDTILDQNTEFNAFKENFLLRNWELKPSAAVYKGYYKHDDQLLLPNGELRARQRGFYVNELLAIKAFDANQLNSANAADLAIIEAQLRSNIWYIDQFREYEWNPALYNPAGAFGVILNTDYKPLAERMEVITRRLKNVPAYYQAGIANIKVPTMQHLELAIQQTAGAVSMFDELIPAKIEAAQLTEVQAGALTANLSAASAASKNYIVWLQNKKADMQQDGTVRDFRIGAELYEEKFKHDIGSGFTAVQLYELALKAKQNLHADMIRITNQLWPDYFPDTDMPEPPLAAVKLMIDKLSERHIGRDQFVDEIRRQIPIIQAFMDEKDLLDSDPSRPLVVRLTPEYQRGVAGASVNAPGPYDATANTYYNVSPLDDYSDEQAQSYLREYNHWILQILNIHEAIPGHYTQLMHANKSPSKIKSIFANGAMVEGWAVYSERMMLEAGYGDNEPEMWLMYSKWNLRVVVNTILDYSVHVLGMEREVALDMLMNEAFQQRTEAEGKWRRATLSQVQLTSYFSGYSEISAFRDELKESLGESFSLKEFHNTFLSFGNAPVPVIKKLMLSALSERQTMVANDESTETELPVDDEEAPEAESTSDTEEALETDPE